MLVVFLFLVQRSFNLELGACLLYRSTHTQTHTYSPVSSRWGINHVYTWRSAEDLSVADGVRDVDVPINTAFNKLHVVLSQSAGLISEHILHLGDRERELECVWVGECLCVVRLCVCVYIYTCPSSSFRSEVLTWAPSPSSSSNISSSHVMK